MKSQLSERASLRLNDIVKNLGVGKRWQGESSERAVVKACLAKVDAIARNIEPRGEVFSERIAASCQVRFAEIHTTEDIDTLEDFYLRQRKEIGFARLRDEITPNVDALLFQRMNAQVSDSDRWVAVLNMTMTKDRAYWNRFHELAHRIAEPPQMTLPFRREVFTETRSDPVEKLMDVIASNLAFHRHIFLPHCKTFSHRALTFDIVEKVRNSFAPSASLLSVVNALVRVWDRPTIAFLAFENTRKNSRNEVKALRVQPQGRNEHAKQASLYLIPNMRVPQTSGVFETYHTGVATIQSENLKEWTTSNGSALPDVQVTVETVRLGSRVYGIMTM